MKCFDVFNAKTVIHYIVSLYVTNYHSPCFAETTAVLENVEQVWYTSVQLLVDRASLTSSCIHFLGFENGAHGKKQIT